MNEIQTMLDAREKYLLKIKKEKERALRKVPEGSLRINQKGNKIQYYHRVDPKDHSGKYIRKVNSELVKQLAQKDYDEKVLHASESELEAIHKFIQLCPEDNVSKMNEYIKHGFYPGQNMILTYETKQNPLNLKIVKQMIEHYLK